MKAYVLFFSILLLFQFTCKAQYTHADKDLIQTTYTRQFDKSIENKYLHSNDSVKVNAALLSLAQSEDTSWVKEILQLDFGKHSKFICFALGELGKNIQSVNFLLSKLSQTNNSDKDILISSIKIELLHFYDSASQEFKALSSHAPSFSFYASIKAAMTI